MRYLVAALVLLYCLCGWPGDHVSRAREAGDTPRLAQAK